MDKKINILLESQGKKAKGRLGSGDIIQLQTTLLCLESLQGSVIIIKPNS